MYPNSTAMQQGQPWVPEKTSVAEREQTPLERMAAAEKSVHALCERVFDLADKLVGPEPLAGGKDDAQQSASCGGVLGACEGSANDLIRRVTFANGAINRILRALP